MSDGSFVILTNRKRLRNKDSTVRIRRTRRRELFPQITKDLWVFELRNSSETNQNIDKAKRIHTRIHTPKIDDVGPSNH